MPRKYKYYDRVKRPKLSLPENSVDYVEYELHDIKKSTGPEIDDFEIETIEEEVKTNIEEFINSFKDQVGVDAVLKRAASGDLSLLNEKEAIYADLTGIPTDAEEAFKKQQATEELFNKIDKELTNGQTMQEFIESLTEEKIKEYISKKIEERTKELNESN